jgi:murein DD-endopeptidase MepM/ murein hydrolase activator NlpD
MRQSCGRNLLLIIVGLIGLCIIAGICWWEGHLKGLFPQPLPLFPTLEPYTSWATPLAATEFDFPLQPAASYGPYIQGVTGPLAVDTRYGVQNPAQGNRSNCFRDANDESVPFSQLYHAGVDLFALNHAGQITWGEAKHASVHAVADGVTVFVLNAGSEGQIIGVEHRLPDGSLVYSVYWHVSHVQVEPGQSVSRGQVIAVVYDMGLNSHLHWEMRTFRDGSNVFPPGTAGARGTCNRQVSGVGYTWDDDPSRAHPGYYGYLDPIAFVESHR